MRLFERAGCMAYATAIAVVQLERRTCQRALSDILIIHNLKQIPEGSLSGNRSDGRSGAVETRGNGWALRLITVWQFLNLVVPTITLDITRHLAAGSLHRLHLRRPVR